MLNKYLITNPSSYQDEQSFREYINNLNGFDYILYRDKANINYRKFAKIFLDTLIHRGEEKFLVHQDIDLAKELGSFGVHLNSKQFNMIQQAKKFNLFTIISCHSIREIQLANELRADAVTFSPIFTTPNKGEPKGVDKLQEVVKQFPQMKIFALGGIVSEFEVAKLNKIDGLFGFSSIRFWVSKRYN